MVNNGMREWYMRISNCVHNVPPFALCGICDLEEMNSILKEINRPWNNIDGPCPYCKINGPCEHWSGCGWSRKTMEEKMNEIEFVKSVQTLEIRENDLIVIKIPYKLRQEVSEKMRKQVEDNLPIGMKGKVKIFILEEGIDIGIIRAEKIGKI
jgi:hypothetical protein